METMDGQFEKLLQLTEKSVTAWEKAYQIIDHLKGENELMRQEFRIIADTLKVRPCMLDDHNRSLKNMNILLSVMTGFIVLASTIVGLLMLFKH